jgi:hypothetical protein
MLEFETPPPISLWGSATKRGRGGDIPRIEARAARLVGDVAPYAAITGSSADPLPLCWPAVLTSGLQYAVMADPAFPHALMGIVHARQRIVRHRHISASEALSGHCLVEGHRVVRSGGEFDLVTTVQAGEETVWEGVTTVHTKGIRGSGGPKSPPPPEPERTAEVEETWDLPGDLGRRYAKIAGDRNPIHLWPVTAWPFGYSRPIIHGWWTLARALTALGDRVPAACEVEARFVGTVPLPGRPRLQAGTHGDSTWFVVRRDAPCVIGSVSPRRG